MTIWDKSKFAECLHAIPAGKRGGARTGEGRSSDIRLDQGGMYQVVTSPRELDAALPRRVVSPDKYSGIIVLCELNWNGEPRSAFYGYDVALDLVRSGTRAPMIFCSFFERQQLLSRVGGTAGLLVQIFPHITLPSDLTTPLEFEAVSPAKWTFLDCVLRKGGLWNLLQHNIDTLIGSELSVERLKEFLAREARHVPSLDGEFGRLFTKARAAADEDRLEDAKNLLGRMSAHLKLIVSSEEENSGQSNPSTGPKPSLLLLEDDQTTGLELKASLENHFDVTLVSNPADALALLNTGAQSYGVVLSDLLLEDERRMWWGTQGVDVLIYAATNHPHLAVHGLTSLPKNMIIELERATNNKVSIWPKSAPHHLPPTMSIDGFCDILLRDMRHRPSPVRVPRNGLWKRGSWLHAVYLRKRSTETWASFWKKLTSDVEEFLYQYDRAAYNDAEWNPSNQNLIPRKLFSLKPPTLKVPERAESTFEEKLLAALKHRLLVLTRAFEDKDGECIVDMERIYSTVGFTMSDDAQYLSQILGFSTRTWGSGSRSYKIENIEFGEGKTPELTLEEEKWIQERYGPIGNKFPELVQLTTQLSLIAQRGTQVSEDPSLLEIQEFLEQVFSSPQPDKVALNIQEYRESEEFDRLGGSSHARLIHELIYQNSSATTDS